MSANVKNYTEQNGERTVIGGEIVIEGSLTVGEEGVIPRADNQAASTATTVADLKTDLNTLISNLKAAGLMAPDA